MKTGISGFSTFLFGVALVFSGAAHAGQKEVNPDYAYFYYGDTPGGWQWVLADPGNWWMPLADNEGVSGTGKLAMTAGDSKEFPGAIKLVWSKGKDGDRGDAVITGRTVDLSAYEDKVQLMLALKLETRSAKHVYVKMLCGDKCEGQVAIHHHLKKMKQNEWFALPIPLDCFVEQGVNLKNITSPFVISTTGEMVLDVAEVSLRPMAKGEEGCVPNDKTPPDNQSPQ